MMNEEEKKEIVHCGGCGKEGKDGSDGKEGDDHAPTDIFDEGEVIGGSLKL